MKKVCVTPSIKEFEEIINRQDIEIIKIDVKACENTYFTQESFLGIIVYEIKESANGK